MAARGYSLPKLEVETPNARQILGELASQSQSSITRWRPTLAASSVRFATTQTSKPISAMPEEASTSAYDQPIDVPLLEDITPSTPNIEPISSIIPDGSLGHLQSVGLDIGYGPTLLMQNALEVCHVVSDTPWVISAIILACLTRAVMFPLMLQSSDTIARQAYIKPQVEEIRKEMSNASWNSDVTEATQVRMRLKKLYHENGIKPWNMFKPMLVQGLAGYGTWRALRRMAELPLPALEDESFFWITDLLQSDPFYVLPACQAVLLYLNVSAARKSNDMSAEGAMPFKSMMYIFPLISFAFLSVQPGIIQISFATTSLLMFLMGATTRNPTFRAKLGLFPLNPRPRSPTSADGGQTLRLVQHLNTTTSPNGTPTYVYDEHSTAAAAEAAKRASKKSKNQTPEAEQEDRADKNFFDRGVTQAKRLFKGMTRSVTSSSAYEQMNSRAEQKMRQAREEARREREREYEMRRRREIERERAGMRRG
ncbi:MAG: hypothetical protein Q9227_004729 [Pyrenula ochraceoflavens]